MRYTLITSKGRIMQFYILATAELYQQLEGGILVDSKVIDKVAETVL